MGQDNFSKFKVTELIGTNHIKIIPEIYIGGGAQGGNAMDAMLGLKLMKEMGVDSGSKKTEAIEEVKDAKAVSLTDLPAATDEKKDDDKKKK